MRKSSFVSLLTLALALGITPSIAQFAQAQGAEDNLIAQRAIRETKEIQGDRSPSIAKAGLLNAARDHYFDVNVTGEALNRIEVECVNFHELENVQVVNPDSGEIIPHNTDYGFEEFVVTFEEPVAVGQMIRIVMEGSTVRGVTTGIIVPYRVFGNSDSLGNIPLGTALVRGAVEK
ncbi:MAG: hypothetical protein AAFQ14_11150 [Cyanobacteria bacterium J06621_12]